MRSNDKHKQRSRQMYDYSRPVSGFSTSYESNYVNRLRSARRWGLHHYRNKIILSATRGAKASIMKLPRGSALHAMPRTDRAADMLTQWSKTLSSVKVSLNQLQPANLHACTNPPPRICTQSFPGQRRCEGYPRVRRVRPRSGTHAVLSWRAYSLAAIQICEVQTD